jgi:hypothetical protein
MPCPMPDVPPTKTATGVPFRAAAAERLAEQRDLNDDMRSMLRVGGWVLQGIVRCWTVQDMPFIACQVNVARDEVTRLDGIRSTRLCGSDVLPCRFVKAESLSAGTVGENTLGGYLPSGVPVRQRLKETGISSLHIERLSFNFSIGKELNYELPRRLDVIKLLSAH